MNIRSTFLLFPFFFLTLLAASVAKETSALPTPYTHPESRAWLPVFERAEPPVAEEHFPSVLGGIYQHHLQNHHANMNEVKAIQDQGQHKTPEGSKRILDLHKQADEAAMGMHNVQAEANAEAAREEQRRLGQDGQGLQYIEQMRELQSLLNSGEHTLPGGMQRVHQLLTQAQTPATGMSAAQVEAEIAQLMAERQAARREAQRLARQRNGRNQS
ncbi:hypothetical protein OC835_005135 [Tilletia horrida]|nr:hypothetical protein OC835_005135 [Tilletia horrida]